MYVTGICLYTHEHKIEKKIRYVNKQNHEKKIELKISINNVLL